jgi:L-lactate permease
MTDTIEKLRLLKGISRTVMPPKLIVFSQTKLKEILANWNHILGFTIQFLIMALILTSVVGPKAPFRMALLQRV